MIPVTSSKIGFLTGDLLAPSDLSEHYDYINDVIKDVAGQRYTHTPVTWQMVHDCATTLTNTDYTADPERCRIRLAVPSGVTAEVERMYLSANYSASAGVDGYLFLSDNSVPSTVVNPVFSLPALAAVSDTETTLLCSQSFTMTSGKDYILELRPTSGGTFTFERCDITAHIKTDCFNFANIDTLDDVDYRFTNTDPPDATRVAAINAAITTASQAINSARQAYRPMLLDWHNFSNATSANQLRIEIPLAKSTKTSSLDYLFLNVVWTAAVTATATLLLANAAGVTQVTTTAVATSAKFATSGQKLANLSLTGTNGAVDVSEDYRATISENSATGIFKATALCWVK